MFAPKWKKEAKLLDKAAKKFLNYKRDLLEDQQIAEIESRRNDLQKARKVGDKEKCDEASKQLQATCENALPRQQNQGWFEENLEVVFVAIVIALGLRAYVVQPFRIPTGSMQPTLNGIVATPLESADEFPNIATRTIQRATHGRKYVDLVLEEDKQLRKSNPIIEQPFMHFFVRTHIFFSDGSKVTFPGPSAALLGHDKHSGKGFGFAQKCQYMAVNRNVPEAKKNQLRNANVPYMGRPGHEQVFILNPVLPKGTVIARGYIDSGDLILVDKMSYHFRRPDRGEVFVFDTRNIRGIQSRENPGSHYIKRLAGVPGDSLELRNIGDDEAGELYINGKPAAEAGFQKVMSKTNGYRGYKAMGKLDGNSLPFKARKVSTPGMNEYIALGDNSFNSSDSRDWGQVKEFNVIGPAAFTLWPFASGHWGTIK